MNVGTRASTASTSPAPTAPAATSAEGRARTHPFEQRPAAWRPRLVRGLLLFALTAASALVRWPGRDFSLWVDEAVSMGVASHPFSEIPAVLARDGSPPLYYVLLHGWMATFGSSPGVARALSLVFALAVVPVAFWAGRSLLSPRAGWAAAVLAATVPYLSVHSREARMYTLLVLVGLVAVTTFLGAVVLGRRRYLPAFALSLAAVLYTHHWGVFLALGLAAAAGRGVAGARDAGVRRRLAVDATIAFGVVALLYAPWVPRLIGQADETGAPWSRAPSLGAALGAIPSVLGGPWVSLGLAAVLVSVAVACSRARRGVHDDDRTGADRPVRPDEWTGADSRAVPDGRLVAKSLVLILAVTLAASWLSSQVTPAWSPRYFAIFLPALILLGALGMPRSGRVGVVGLGAVVVLWTVPLPLGTDGRAPGASVPKSNVEALAAGLEELLQPGDVVLSTQIEQVPLLAYYLGSDLRYADPTGAVTDPTVADWRNALARMRTADPVTVLDPLVDGLDAGGHVLVVCPRLFTDEDDLLWYRLMDRHCDSATSALDDDARVTRLWGPEPGVQSVGASVAVTVYERVNG